MKRRQKSRFYKQPEQYKLTVKQANVYAWGWQQEARFRDVVAGRRFGKSFLAADEILRAVKLAIKWGVDVSNEIWYAAPTFKQAKRIFWRRIKAAIPQQYVENINNTECVIELISGHVIRVVGAQNYEDLRGSGLFFLVIDEWATCRFEAWIEVFRPMLSTCKWVIDNEVFHGGHVLRIGSPAGMNHCYDSYNMGQGQEPDHKSWQYTTLQGGNVPASEVEAARRVMDIRTFRQEYEASFENFSGIVYYTFDRKESDCNVTIKTGETLHIGMDFNIEHMAAVVIVQRDGRSYVVDEIHNEYNTESMIRKIKSLYAGHNIYIYPDASGKSRKPSASKTDIEMLRAAGFMVRANNKNPAIKDRVNCVNAALLNAAGERRLLVNIARCPNLRQALERQVWDGDEPDKNKEHGYDHINDALGYYALYVYPIKTVAKIKYLGLHR